MSNYDKQDSANTESNAAEKTKQVGRPAKAAVGPIKKGKTSWSPASLNEFSFKEEGYRYRMSRNDPENLAKKSQEGWETVSGIQSGQTKHNAAERINDGSNLTSVLEGRDWVLQRLPEDLAAGRDEYYNSEVERRTAGLTSHIKKEIGKSGANTHGQITISSRNGEQVIE